MFARILLCLFYSIFLGLLYSVIGFEITVLVAIAVLLVDITELTIMIKYYFIEDSKNIEDEEDLGKNNST